MNKTPEIAAAIARKPPSWTARMMACDIAEGLPSWAPARLQAIFETLMPPQTVALTARLVAHLSLELPFFFRGLLQVRKVSGLLRRLSLRLFFDDRHYLNSALRKRIFYDEVEAALAQGARQVVVLGAGFDVLCLQLASRHPQVLFVEVDQQNTQALKRQAVMALCAGQPPANLAFVAVDFRHQSLEEELQTQLGNTWQVSLSSVAVVEGVWPYLDEAAIRASLQSFRKISAAGSTYLFTYFVLGGARWQQKITAASTLVFALVGEPVRYLPTDKQQIEALLVEEGYAVDLSVSRTHGYVRYIVPAGFEDHVGPERILDSFVGVAVSQTGCG